MFYGSSRPGGGADNGNAIDCDSSGNVYLTGNTPSNVTFDTASNTSSGSNFIAKYTALGNAHWVRRGSGSGFSISWSNNNVNIAGQTTQNATFGNITFPNYGITDILVAQLEIPPCLTINPSFTITCLSDSTVELVADPGYENYKWSDGQFGQSIEVSDSGTYYMVVLDSNNCTGTSAPQDVQVSPAPAVSASGPLEFCIGGSVSLTAVAGFASYQWNTGDTTQGITASISDTITVTVTDSLGCTKVSEDVVVTMHDPQPVIESSGSTDLCEGESVSLSTQQAYDSYAWTGVSNGSSITVSQAGTYNVTVSEGPGCTASAIAVNTNVTDSTITIAGDGPLEFCEGEEVTLSTTATIISQYNWSTGATGSTVTITQSASVLLNVTFTNGCEATSNTLDITVYPNPTPPIITQSGLDQLNGTGGFFTYQWLLDGQEIAGATDSTHTATATGGYTVVVTDINGCQAVSEPFEHAVGIGESYGEQGVSVYPNPSMGSFTVTLPPGDDVEILLTDPLGRSVNHRWEKVGKQSYRLELLDNAKGTYHLNVQSIDWRGSQLLMVK